ncbi:MAG TPA: type II toxin-antitoxin system VapC family toxin [Caulobacteraceae bacterium]|jgi:predicted nucleic acid-binding protein
MLDEAVLDASVAVKVVIDEDGSDRARALAMSGARFAAPEFVLAEIASVLLKHLRRGEIARSYADAALACATGLFDELVPTGRLTARAFEIAADHGTSAYDALYVALAETRRWPLATADLRLVQRLGDAGLAIGIWTP